MVQDATTSYAQLESNDILLYIAYDASNSIAGAFSFVQSNYDVEKVNYFTKSISWIQQGPHMVVVDLSDMRVLASDYSTYVDDAISLCNNK
ncbi:MAG: hypothetical protein QNJ97_23845 [Myxococcota bacterium]|nr:hypothetical protein [Myxococcota bacterium]